MVETAGQIANQRDLDGHRGLEFRLSDRALEIGPADGQVFNGRNELTMNRTFLGSTRLPQ